MDPRRFDDLTRVLGRRTSRRGFGRLVVALLTAGWSVRVQHGVSAQAACESDDTCPAGSICWEGVCCFAPSTACSADVPCCDVPRFGCCDGLCVDLLYDSLSCSACGNACPADTRCCDGSCVPLLDDANCRYCGDVSGPCETCSDIDGRNECRYTCVSGEACVDGVCVGCGEGLTACYGSCVDLLTDNQNCGMCDFPCDEPSTIGTPAGSYCENGSCRCPEGRVICFNSSLTEEGCYDLSRSTINCGTCENNCDVPPYPVGSICVDGACACPGGGSACGDVCCPPEATCVDGQCQCESGNCDCSGYSFPFLTCGGRCVNFVDDPLNCGGCDRVCPDGICERQRCLGCESGLSACDGLCVDITVDPRNCGGCGIACDPGVASDGGECVGASGPGEEPTPGPDPTVVPGASDESAVVTMPRTGRGTGEIRRASSEIERIAGAAGLAAAIAAWIGTRIGRGAQEGSGR